MYVSADGHIILCYVDDLLMFGKAPEIWYVKLGKHLLIKKVGELTPKTPIQFIGRDITHTGDSIQLRPMPGYIEELLKEQGLSTGPAVAAPGTPDKKSTNGVSELAYEEARNYRGVVGKLMWLIPVRPDINFAVQ